MHHPSKEVNRMFVQHDSLIAFTGSKTTDQERMILAKAGFVHVTGLRCYYHNTPTDEYFIGTNVRPEELGHWEHNNGVNVIVTLGGEVWVMTGPCPDQESEVVKDLAPSGRGAFVPMSNGDVVSLHELLSRVRDPNHNIFVPLKS